MVSFKSCLFHSYKKGHIEIFLFYFWFCHLMIRDSWFYTEESLLRNLGEPNGFWDPTSVSHMQGKYPALPFVILFYFIRYRTIFQNHLPMPFLLNSVSWLHVSRSEELNNSLPSYCTLYKTRSLRSCFHS